jgi:YD repeat-containing protein
MSTRLTRPHLWVVTVVMGAMVILGAPPSVRAQDNKAALKVDPFFGGLQQQVPIEVPAFRGLEPRLALAYSSSAGNGLAGVGWTLTGVGAIERGQKGRGAPNYDGADVFFLDGQELVPCVGGMISPSCTTCPAGYTCYATRIEGFQRIGYRASDDTWALWEKDGTRVSFAPTHRASTPSQSCTSNTVSGSSGAWSGWSGYYLTDLGGSGTALSATRYGEYGNESKAMTIGGAAMSSGGWSGWSGYYLTDVTASGNTLTVQRYGEYGNETRTIYLGGNITATDGGWSGWSGYYVTDIAVSGTAITLTRAGEYGNETKTISLSNVVCTPTQTALGTFRWGQQSVADTSGNTVNYAWWCDGNPHLACYPDTVSYNGTTVRFWREARPDPHNFSTGSGTVGRQSYRLRSIDVTVSGSRARAYKLGYTTAPSTGRSTLASVQQFGRDATVDGAGGVSGGTALPANSFGYDGLAPATTTCRLDSAVVSGGMASNWGECTPYLHAVSAGGNAITFSSGCGSGAVTLNNVTVSGGLAQSWGECTPWVYQVTASGNQLTFHTNCGTGTVTLSGATVSGGFSPGWGECTPYVDSVTASGNTITFNSNCGTGAVTVESTNACASSPHANSTYDGHGSGGHGDSFADLDGDGDNEYVTRNNFTHYVTTYGPTGVTNQTFTGCHGVGAHGWTYTDVDGDGKQEYVTRTSSTHYITRYVGGACVSQTFTGGHGVGSHGWTYADIDGDGKQEYVTRTGGTHYITRYTATGLTNQTFTNCHGVGSTGWSYADVDGDGKQEYVTHSSGTFYISRYGATGCVNQTFTGGFGVGSDGWTFADVDGDGKQEYVTRNGGTHLVTRFTARGLLNQTITGCHGRGSDGWTYADVDGDGQSDYLTRTGSTHYRSRYTATGCVNESFLAHGSGTTGSTWVDIDGDRRADYVARSGGKHYVTRYGWRPDTLTSVTGMFGSTSTIAYKPATAWPNTNAVPASPTVASITTSDGRGTSSTTNYAYQGGLWSATERRFLGFRKVTTVVDAAGNYTETYYHQHVGCIAKPEATYFRNAAGQIFTYSSYSYAENAAPPYTSLLTQRWDYECNLDASCRRLVTTLGYDTYGNVTASYEYGDYDVAGDERTTTRGYYPNTAAYITGHPAYENVHAGIGTGGALKRQTLNTYDGGTTYAAAPGSRGLLTRRQRWLDQTGGYATRSFAYDAWGNRTSETDEVGATQTFTFDSTYRMYRTRRCDALNHCQATTYDVVLGGVTSDTDPNSKTHSRTYDALGRLATETPPMGGTIQYQYLSWGSPTAQRIRQILPDGSADGLWAEQYLDGAGRTYRWVREGGLERSQLFFGLTTRTWKLSAWYAPASGPPTYQVYAYDGAGRMVRSTNPDGTFAEVSYGDGYVVRTNEVGDVRTEYQDGSGQIGRVVEWDGTTSRSTSYNRDALGRLVSTVDSAGATSTSTWDSLDRRIATCDPDLGCWSYGYDLAGRQTSSTDARGVTLTMTYDAGGRPLRRTRPDGTAVVWTYDEAGHGDGKGDRPTSVTWATGSDSFTYDATGRVTRNTRCVLGQCRTTSWTYDALGRQTDGDLRRRRGGDHDLRQRWAPGLGAGLRHLRGVEPARSADRDDLRQRHGPDLRLQRDPRLADLVAGDRLDRALPGQLQLRRRGSRDLDRVDDRLVAQLRVHLRSPGPVDRGRRRPGRVVHVQPDRQHRVEHDARRLHLRLEQGPRGDRDRGDRRLRLRRQRQPHQRWRPDLDLGRRQPPGLGDLGQRHQHVQLRSRRAAHRPPDRGRHHAVLRQAPRGRARRHRDQARLRRADGGRAQEHRRHVLDAPGSPGLDQAPDLGHRHPRAPLHLLGVRPHHRDHRHRAQRPRLRRPRGRRRHRAGLHERPLLRPGAGSVHLARHGHPGSAQPAGAQPLRLRLQQPDQQHRPDRARAGGGGGLGGGGRGGHRVLRGRGDRRGDHHRRLPGRRSGAHDDRRHPQRLRRRRQRPAPRRRYRGRSPGRERRRADLTAVTARSQHQTGDRLDLRGGQLRRGAERGQRRAR